MVPLMVRGAEIMEGDQRKESGFVFLPIIFYTPESKVGGGGGLIYYNYGDSDGGGLKPDTIRTFLMYTQLHQVIGIVDVIRYLNDKDYKLSGKTFYRKFPSRFYGIGPDTTSEMEEEYTPRDLTFSLSLMKSIVGDLYIGPLYRFSRFMIDEVEKDGLLSSGGIRGSEGAVSSGLGIQMSCDRRDSVFYPMRGFLFDWRGIIHRSEIKSENDFSLFRIDYRHFFQIEGYHILAIQTRVTHSNGRVPFQEMPRVGGASMMRGYYRGRFIDKNFVAFQGEYRFPMIWRFGGAVFAGLSQVAQSPEKFSSDNLKRSAGAGLRFTINREQNINFRIDFAFYDPDFEKETYGFYFTMMEAF
jgi:outer membrane protein assembly factor BamA